MGDVPDTPAAFAELYDRHAVRVAGYLAWRVGSELAEDLTAEVFARAFRARRRYRPEHDTPLPWLLGIASHLVADHRRAERRRLRALERLAAITPLVSHDAAPALGAELIAHLRRLPRAERDTLLLVVWGELTYEEAAFALGIPVGTVRSRIARARRRLAAALGPAARPSDTTTVREEPVHGC